MSNESKDNINLSELLLKISTDVAEIKSDMSNFKENYKSEKERKPEVPASTRDEALFH